MPDDLYIPLVLHWSENVEFCIGGVMIASTDETDAYYRGEHRKRYRFVMENIVSRLRL